MSPQMNDSVIPRNAKILAVALAMMILGFLALGAHFSDKPAIPIWVWAILGTVIPLLVGGMVMLYGYIYGDAKRRGMRPVLWVLLAIFIPNLIGVLLYFVLRDPLPEPCPRCGAAVQTGYAYCPSCAAPLRPACPHCRSTISPGWTHCAHCGARLR